MAVWRLITHHGDQERILQWARTNGVVAIGWTAVGELTKFRSLQELDASVRRHHPRHRNKGVAARQLWSFLHEVKPGDRMILSASGRRAVVMQITGDYFFDANANEDNFYGHQRKAVVLNTDANELWKAAGGMAQGMSIRWTLIRCAKDPG